MPNIDAVQGALTALERTFVAKQRQKKIPRSTPFKPARQRLDSESNHYRLVCVDRQGKPIVVAGRGGRNVLEVECRVTITGSTPLPPPVHRTKK